jgi:nitroreductase
MPHPDAAAFAFLAARRSHPLRTLAAPAPDRAALAAILAAALRVPDHGKLEPWRLVVLQRAALDRLAALVAARGAALGRAAADIAKAQAVYAGSPLAVAVVASPKDSPKVPPVEQMLSAGALCHGLLTAALAAGWGANWLTGWPVHDRGFAEAAFGLAPAEWVAGVIHIGTVTDPLPDRPRPDLARVVTWADR